MNKATINFGIIGTGNIAHLHAIALEMASNAQCVAVANEFELLVGKFIRYLNPNSITRAVVSNCNRIPDSIADNRFLFRC